MSNGNAHSGSRSGIVFAVTLASLIASFVFVATRLVTRIAILHKTSWDDYFITLAWSIAFGLCFAVCFGTGRGLGKHDSDIRPEWERGLKYSEYFFSVLYNPALMATKTSILIFYLKLSETQKFFRWASVSTLVVVNVGGAALTILNIAQCSPISATFLSPLPKEAKCTDIVTLYLSSAPVNIITDLAILFLPMPLLTSLRLPRKQKNILVFVFGLGGFVAVVDVVRIAYLQQASSQSLSHKIGDNHAISTAQAEQQDFPWNASLSFMWSAIEVNVGIICACIPTLKPLVSRYSPRMIRDEPSDTTMRRIERELDFVELQKPTPSRSEKGRQRASPAASNHNGENGAGDQTLLDFLATPGMAQHRAGSTSSGSLHNMVGFLTTPDMKELPNTLNSESGTARRRTQGAPQAQYHTFINLNGPKSMVKLTNRESWIPLAQISLLFFMWGFAYGLLDVLNSQFQQVGNMTPGQTIGLHSAYFSAYFVGPATFGRLVLKMWGFKATFITGLCIYACGTLIFWPSAVLISFPAFLVSNFVVGLGLSTLEIAANPFIALCGPPAYGEIRLNVAQGVQAVGSVISPILARRVLFKSVMAGPALVDVQWTYLGIALFDVLLAVAFYYLPLPEASDEDLEEVALTNEANSWHVGKIALPLITLGLGVWSQWFYTAAQEAVSTAFIRVVRDSLRPSLNSLQASDFQTLGHGIFACGRFLAAFAYLFITPRKIFPVFYVGCIIMTALIMRYSGDFGFACILLLYLFQSAIWPTIFAISLRGTGSHTKTGACLLTIGASGGAVFPPFMRPITDEGPRISMAVPLTAYALAAIFPIYLNAYPKARKQVDPVIIPYSPGNRSSRSFSSLRKRRNRVSTEIPTSEHHEEIQHHEEFATV